MRRVDPRSQFCMLLSSCGGARILNVHRIRTGMSSQIRRTVLRGIVLRFLALELTGRSPAVAREVRNRFLEIGSKTELAEYLGIPLKELTFFAYSGKDFYKSYRIPKRNGQDTRLIEAPAPKLKMLQRKIAHAISEIYTMRLQIGRAHF